MAVVTKTNVPDKLILREYSGVYHWDGTELDEMPSFKCRPNDVWVCSFPRSGTTLTQQIVYLVVTLDFKKAVTIPLDDRFPHAEPKTDIFSNLRGLSYIDKIPESETRMIKSHLHYYLLPEELKKGKGRIVYITRNPKSSVPSLYRVLKYIKHTPADSLSEYLEMFLNDKGVLACPWGLHVRQYWEHRNDSNILFLQFETLVKNVKGAIRQIAEFLGRDLNEEQVEKIFQQTTLETMKANDTVNYTEFEKEHETDKSAGAFINTGEVSGWKKDISEEMSKRFDEYIRREIGETDIHFD